MSSISLCKLRDVAEIIRGVTFGKHEVEYEAAPGLVPVLRAGNITDAGLRLADDLVWIPDRFVSEKQMLRPGDIAIATSSGSALVLGKTAMLEEPWRGSVGAFCAIIRFGPQVDPGYAAVFFRSGLFANWRDSQAQGANIQNLRKSELEDMQFPVPDMREQKAIASAGALLSAAMEMRRRSNVLGTELVESLYRDMFDADDATWTKARIGDITSIVTSGSTPLGGAAVYVDNGPYFLRSQNVRMNELDLRDVAHITNEVHESMGRTKVLSGDVLLNITGASIGRVACVPELDSEANVNQHVCIIRLDQKRAKPEFVSVTLSLPRFQNTIQQIQAGASRQGLNHKQVRELEIPLPPVALQQEFADRLATLRALQERQSTTERLLNELTDAIIEKAFKAA